jgi:predicted naringenin-chalcone synthase
MQTGQWREGDIIGRLVCSLALAPPPRRGPARLEERRTPISGLGCVAGAAGIARAADYVRAFPGEIALLLSAELCSLAWQGDDRGA